MVIVQVLWHSRGGLGAVTSADLLANATIIKSPANHSQAYPHYGAERRGAPVRAYTRLSNDERIRRHSPILHPDIVAVMDPSLLTKVDVTAGMKKGAIVINSPNPPDLPKKEGIRVFYSPLTQIGLDLGLKIGATIIVNTAMLGALVKAGETIFTDEFSTIVDLPSMEQAIKEHFKGERGEKNAQAARTSYEKLKEA